MTDAILEQVQQVVPNIPLTVVSQGAEALVFTTEQHPYSSTADSQYIVKYRPAKPYRHPKIDSMITKSRTIGEAKFMAKLLKLGVRAPALILLDAPNGVIWMEYVGTQLPDGSVSSAKNYLWLLEKSGDKDSCVSTEVEQILKATGESIGKLHMNDMIHGDLTTSNIILQDDDAFLIDFGLSSYSSLPEDKAVDLYVMERAVVSTHSDYADQYNAWLLQGYKQAHENMANVGGRKKLQETLRKLEDVRLRGRKRSMLG